MAAKPFALSVKALVRDAPGRCLLIQRSAGSSFWPGLWDLPGGKVDPGETFDVALIREAREETGFEIELQRYLGGIEWELPHVRLVFVVMLALIHAGTVHVSDEHDAWRWVETRELSKFAIVEPLARVLSAANLDPAPSQLD